MIAIFGAIFTLLGMGVAAIGAFIAAKSVMIK